MQANYYVRAKPYERPIVRFEAQYIPEPNSGCWLWIGSLISGKLGSQPRPTFYLDGKSVRAHRFALEHFKGSIPSGLNACHTCHNTFCVNPEHLYAGTQQQNVADMMRAGRHYVATNPTALAALRSRFSVHAVRRKAKLFCKNGHSRAGDNIYDAPSGRRVCRECMRQFKRDFRARQKEAANDL